MNSKGYYVVHEWMITELGLKGTDLLVFAIIYGFTQIEEQEFFGSRRYLSSFTGASVSSVQRSLDALVEKGLLVKNVSEVPVNGVRLVSYRAVLDTQCQNEPGVKMTHIDNIHISSNKGKAIKAITKFVVPTLEEISAYCNEKGYKINPEAFHAYYSSNGWRVGRSPMKDWKAAVRTWVINERKRNVDVGKKDEPNWGD